MGNTHNSGPGGTYDMKVSQRFEVSTGEFNKVKICQNDNITNVEKTSHVTIKTLKQGVRRNTSRTSTESVGKEIVW